MAFDLTDPTKGDDRSAGSPMYGMDMRGLLAFAPQFLVPLTRK